MSDDHEQHEVLEPPGSEQARPDMAESTEVIEVSQADASAELLHAIRELRKAEGKIMSMEKMYDDQLASLREEVKSLRDENYHMKIHIDEVRSHREESDTGSRNSEHRKDDVQGDWTGDGKGYTKSKGMDHAKGEGKTSVKGDCMGYAESDWWGGGKDYDYAKSDWSGHGKSSVKGDGKGSGKFSGKGDGKGSGKGSGKGDEKGDGKGYSQPSQSWQSNSWIEQPWKNLSHEEKEEKMMRKMMRDQEAWDGLFPPNERRTTERRTAMRRAGEELVRTKQFNFTPRGKKPEEYHTREMLHGYMNVVATVRDLSDRTTKAQMTYVLIFYEFLSRWREPHYLKSIEADVIRDFLADMVYTQEYRAIMDVGREAAKRDRGQGSSSTSTSEWEEWRGWQY